MKRIGEPWARQGRGWYVTVSEDGIAKQIPLGVHDPDDKAAAWEARNKLAAELASKAVRPGSLAELLPQFLDFCAGKGCEPKTVRDYGYNLKWLLAQSEGCAIGDLDPVYLERRARNEKWSDSHRNNVLATVQKFARWAGRDTFTVTRPPKESRGADSVISEETYLRILRETTGDFHQLLKVLWETGARPSEIATLTAELVDFKSQCSVLKKHKTKKKGKKRIIPYNAAALAVLREQVDKHKTGHIFRGVNGEPFTAHAIACRLIRVAERCGVKVTAYGFRHSFATRALEQGMSDSYVAAALGHSSTRMIHTNYSHLSESTTALVEMVNKMKRVG